MHEVVRKTFFDHIAFQPKQMSKSLKLKCEYIFILWQIIGLSLISTIDLRILVVIR